MVAIIYLYNDFLISIIWKQKINLIGGIFLGIAIYSYFHRKKQTEKEIFELRKQSKYFEILTRNLIQLAMGDQEKFSIKEMISTMSDDLKDFKSEIRADIKDLVFTFHSYKESNNARISKLETRQGITSSKIATYVGFISVFIMLAINTYMSLKG